MDKLRALQYFVSAADGASFSAAARQHGVSAAAVAKQLGALERDLGVQLFERSAHGIALTTAASAYLENCREPLAMLTEADEQAMSTASRIRGIVVVAVQPVIAQESLTAALPRFNALYPDIQLDVRYFMKPEEEQVRGVDVMLVMGWPENTGDLVQRRIGATSFVVCAAPSYWARYGMPQHPSELEAHNCMCIRSNRGSVMDLWNFSKGNERVSVAARGWLVVDNAHRDMVRDLAVGGAGVARILDWHQRRGHETASGSLVPALTDWSADEVPPVNLLYSQSARRIPRVRLFIDFVTQLFRDIEQQRPIHAPATNRPQWLRTRKSRASASVRR
jgi:LysR family transcriptional regulator, regulator for bpeEF and oprC